MMKLLSTALIVASTLAAAASPLASQADHPALTAYGEEPSIQRVHRLAVAYAGLEPARIRRLLGRARLAAIVPDVRFKVSRSFDDESRAGTAFDERGHAEDVSGTEMRERQLRLEGEFRWFPSEVLFRQEETKLVRESRHAAGERARLLEAVTRIYFERRRAQLVLSAATEADEAARVSMMLDVQQLTAELDAYTGGAFSRLMPRKVRP